MAVELKHAIYLGLGGATKGVVVAGLDVLAKRITVDLKIAPELLAGILGYVVADRTAEGTFWNFWGKGVLVGAISQIAREPVEAFLKPIGAPPPVKKSPEERGGGEVKEVEPAEYIKRKYGI